MCCVPGVPIRENMYKDMKEKEEGKSNSSKQKICDGCIPVLVTHFLRFVSPGNHMNVDQTERVSSEGS